ncbi:hypothetical protein IQ07DRAFT_10726 [Pyrenochaeta sp. DS3sAY3a]|nr:hypothetical protein IQ07DRAFT_10726 [Pyrenochaeta sp. DS3sAY3a]
MCVLVVYLRHREASVLVFDDNTFFHRTTPQWLPSPFILSHLPVKTRAAHDNFSFLPESLCGGGSSQLAGCGGCAASQDDTNQVSPRHGWACRKRAFPLVLPAYRFPRQVLINAAAAHDFASYKIVKMASGTEGSEPEAMSLQRRPDRAAK